MGGKQPVEYDATKMLGAKLASGAPNDELRLDEFGQRGARLADFPQDRPAFDRRAEEAGEARQTSVEEDFLQGAEAGAALRVAQRCMNG
jgi:hypothetical protein